MAHDELEELLEQIQGHYLEQFEIAIAKYGHQNIILEPALRHSSGEMATEGRLRLPARVDFVVLDRVDRSPIASVNIDSKTLIQFGVMDFSLEGSEIRVAPFSWDWITLRSDLKIVAADAVVESWFAVAFKENEGLAPPFFSCAHFISEPKFIDGLCEVRLDAGSSPPDMVMALLDQMIGAGAKRISIG